MWKPEERIRHDLLDPGWPTAEAAARSRVFSPVEVGAVRLEQRTWVPAMVPWRATEDGFVTDDLLAWYERFARGRPGALVVEATGIRDVPSGPLLRVGDDRFVPGLARLVETVRGASGGHTRLFLQIIDFLAIRRRPERDKYFSRFLHVLPEELRDDLRAHNDALTGEILAEISADGAFNANLHPPLLRWEVSYPTGDRAGLQRPILVSDLRVEAYPDDPHALGLRQGLCSPVSSTAARIACRRPSGAADAAFAPPAGAGESFWVTDTLRTAAPSVSALCG